MRNLGERIKRSEASLETLAERQKQHEQKGRVRKAMAKLLSRNTRKTSYLSEKEKQFLEQGEKDNWTKLLENIRNLDTTEVEPSKELKLLGYKRKVTTAIPVRSFDSVDQDLLPGGDEVDDGAYSYVRLAILEGPDYPTIVNVERFWFIEDKPHGFVVSYDATEFYASVDEVEQAMLVALPGFIQDTPDWQTM